MTFSCPFGNTHFILTVSEAAHANAAPRCHSSHWQNRLGTVCLNANGLPELWSYCYRLQQMTIKRRENATASSHSNWPHRRLWLDLTCSASSNLPFKILMNLHLLRGVRKILCLLNYSWGNESNLNYLLYNISNWQMLSACIQKRSLHWKRMLSRTWLILP